MKKIIKPTLYIAGAAIVVFLFYGLIQVLRLKGVASGEAAGWMQAIGSIAAIGGAYAIGERQAKATLSAATKTQELAEAKRLSAIFAICAAAKNRTDIVRDIFCSDVYESGKRFMEYDHSLIRSVINAIGAVPVHEIGNSEAATALMDIKDQLDFLIRSIDEFDHERSESMGITPMQKNAFNIVLRGNIQIHVEQIFRNYEILQRTIGTCG